MDEEAGGCENLARPCPFMAAYAQAGLFIVERHKSAC
jgi:hypothetical protein